MPHLQPIPSDVDTADRRQRPGIIARLVHGVSAGAVATLLGIASNLLLLPLYLHSWTVGVYGEWMALYSVVNYLGTLDFGVTTAAINAATMAYARNDWQTFKRVQGTALAASFALAGLGALVVAAILILFPVDRWLGLKAIGSHDSQFVFGCLAVALLMNIPGRQLSATYIAMGEFAKYQWIYNGGILLSAFAIGAGLILGARPSMLAFVTALAAILSIICTYALLWQRDSRLIPRFRDADWATGRLLAAPTGQFGIQMAASALLIQGPVVILSRALGGPSVALFTTTRTITNVVRAVIMLLRAPLRPEFAAAAAQSTKDTLRSLFRIAVALDTVIAVSLAAALWSGGIWLIRFWSHDHIPPDPRLLHLLLLFSLVDGFIGILVGVGLATNRLTDISLAQLVYSVASLALTAASIRRFGVSAVPIGCILPLLVFMLPAAMRNARSAVDLSLHDLITRMVLPFAAVLLFLAVLQTQLISLRSGPEWVSASVGSVMTCLVACIAAGTAVLTANDRRMVLSRLGVSFKNEV